LGLQQKLTHWCNAGIITSSQVEAIQSYESGHAKTGWRYGLIFLAVLAIGVGFALIVASNWDAISWQIKLGLHAVINLGLALWLINRYDRISRNIAPDMVDVPLEIGIFFLWVLVLTFMALNGQIFQLSGTAEELLRVWFWITAPMIAWFARSKYILTPFAALLGFYVFYEIDHFIRLIYQHELNWLNYAYAVFIPVLFFCAGSELQRHHVKLLLGRIFIMLATVFAILAASTMASFTRWYVPESDMVMRTLPYALMLAILIIGFIHPRFILPEQKTRFQLLLFAGGIILLPGILPFANTVFSALLFTALWLGVGYYGKRENEVKLVDLCVVLIAIRIYVAFWELFGTMLQTGVGLIAAGVILLCFIYASNRIRLKLRNWSQT